MAIVLAAFAGFLFWALVPAPAFGLPRADASLLLRDGRYLHLLPLPLGQMRGAIVGSAAFDASGSRAALVATFPDAGVGGDWRSASPSQAFAIDFARRTVTQLTVDGRATSVAWTSSTAVRVTDGADTQTIDVGDGASFAPPVGRIAPDALAYGRFVSPKSTDRLAVWRHDDERYAISQIGARALRTAGVASNGAFAIIGNFAAWIDSHKAPGNAFARLGPDNAAPLNFSGSPYGDALWSILPLGYSVFQGAYRNGMAYFAFSYGLERIVAATPDFVNYLFPPLPHDPIFTVGDGLGAGSDNRLYFFRPEEDQMLFWRSGSYHRLAMNIPDSALEMAPLSHAMTMIAKTDPLWPPLRRSEDALDSAMLEWRFYPVGEVSGSRWLASHLGQVLIGDGAGHFSIVPSPRFPFAVLGRTDDGRVWGAAPLDRSASSSIEGSAHSGLWWTRDGATWHHAATLEGDAGAVAVVNGTVWVALTRGFLGRSMIFVTRLGTGTAEELPTAATYGGESMFFAPVATGLFLVCGVAPGRRLATEGGALAAYRVDVAELSHKDDAGRNKFVYDRLDPGEDPSLPAAHFEFNDAAAVLGPTLRLVPTLAHKEAWLTIRTNIAPEDAALSGATIMSPDQERAFELKYAGTPYPLASVLAAPESDGMVVTRIIEYGPLKAQGAVETWGRDEGGNWRRTSVRSTFSY